jgi:hypothetical protein
MAPFALLCQLLDAWLARQPVAPVVVEALGEATPWPRLVTLSGVHLLTPALAPALADPAVYPRVPAELLAYLAAMHEAATLRNATLRHDLMQVAAQLNEIGVVPVALKGAIRLVDGLWPDPTLRFMHDLDLLVPEAALEACGSQLARAGWLPLGGEPDGGDHHLALAHPEAAARVELHWTALASPLGSLLPPARLLARARPVRADGATIAVPAIDDQLVHVVAHGMLQHAFLENGRFLLRDLVEQALLLGRASEAERRAAMVRLALAGRSRAWEVSCLLTALCLPQGAPMPSAPALATRLLARRMLLQQRSPVLMDLLGPTGWLLARALAGSSSATPGRSLPELAEQLLIFRRKTRW